VKLKDTYAAFSKKTERPLSILRSSPVTIHLLVMFMFVMKNYKMPLAALSKTAVLQTFAWASVETLKTTSKEILFPLWSLCSLGHFFKYVFWGDFVVKSSKSHPPFLLLYPRWK